MFMFMPSQCRAAPSGASARGWESGLTPISTPRLTRPGLGNLAVPAIATLTASGPGLKVNGPGRSAPGHLAPGHNAAVAAFAASANCAR
jgi:hypothetical protein